MAKWPSVSLRDDPATHGPSVGIQFRLKGEKPSFLWAIVLTSIAFCLFCAVLLPIGLLSNVLKWDPTYDGLLRTSIIALFLPALGEELLFRGPLLLWPRLWVSLLLIVLFIAWHPIEAVTFLPHAKPYFLDPFFLIIVAGLALLTTTLTLRTRRLWPAILCHWTIVVAWKQLFGGPHLLGGT